MEKIISLDDFLTNKNYFVKKAKENKLFIYPTDSLYGIWAVFTEENIRKIAKIKERDSKKPMSVIAPNRKWIENNFDIESIDKIKQLYYKYKPITFILKAKSKLFSYNDSLWVRIIDHPFQDFVSSLWKPFITTSANIAWKANILNTKELEKKIVLKVDIIVDWGDIYGKPSTIIDMINNKIIRR